MVGESVAMLRLRRVALVLICILAGVHSVVRKHAEVFHPTVLVLEYLSLILCLF